MDEMDGVDEAEAVDETQEVSGGYFLVIETSFKSIYVKVKQKFD